MKLSILIPTYRYDPRPLVRSLCGMLPGETEILVGDDHSATPEAEAYLADLGRWEHVRVVRQGEYVAKSLQSYFARHPEMESRCTKGGGVRYLTTENAERFSESAQLFLHEQVKVEHIDLV